MNKKVVSSVKALILNNDKYLFLKEKLRKKNVWDLPGGKIEYGETPYEALQREVKEETDLEIKIIKPLGLFWFFSTQQQHQVIAHTFLCEIVGEAKVDPTKNPADEEIIDFKWLNKKELLQNDLSLPASLTDLLNNFLNR